jgi:manganese/zinc/iron transport system permease protein
MWASLTLQAGYNAALVSLGAAMLGLTAGAVGAFLYLRRRALVSDAMAHATLPGIGLAFLAMAATGGDGRFLPGLMLGAAVTAGLGLLCVQIIGRRLSEDAAIGVVLSTFYGAGIVILTVIQSAGMGRPAGLEGVLLGQASAMLASDVTVIALGAAVILLALWALRRPFAMVAFDAGHATGLGLRVRLLDTALLALTLGVVLIGLQVVGLILIVALLIIPAATGRLWSNRVGIVVLIAACVGAVAGYGGAAISATAPNLPTGAVTVLLAFAVFGLSVFIAPRGLLARWHHGR